LKFIILLPEENTNMQSQSLYHRLGGDSVLQKFVVHLYDFMESSPEVVQVRGMHPADLSHAREALYMFLSGMLGGPALYMETFGPPRLRRKHLHFSIGNSERNQWLSCAQAAAEQLDIEPSLRHELMSELTAMANHLRNQQDGLVQARCASM
jgi:hemoglobin